MSTIRVVVIPTEGEPTVADVENDFEAFQKVVGGYYEAIMLSPALYLIVNEDGLMKRLPYNSVASKIAGQSLVGTVFLTRVNPAGTNIHLTDDDVARVIKK